MMLYTKYESGFRKKTCLKKLLTHGRTDGRTIDDGQCAITIAHLKHFVLR